MLDAEGTFTPTAGQTVEVVTVGPSPIAQIVADTIPAISGLADLSASYGASVTINAALKSSGSNLVYSLTGPAWLSINSSTGQITGTAPSADVTTTATVTVSNSAGSASDDFSVNVVASVASIAFSAPPVSGSPVTATVTVLVPGWSIVSAYGRFGPDGVTIGNPSAGVYTYTAPTAGIFRLDVTLTDGTTTTVVSGAVAIAYAAAASMSLAVSPSVPAIGDTVTVSATISNGVAAAFSAATVTIDGVAQTVTQAYPSFSFVASTSGTASISASALTDNGTASASTSITVSAVAATPAITFTTDNVISAITSPPAWLVTTTPFFIDFPQNIRRRVNRSAGQWRMEGRPWIASGNAVIRQNGNSAAVTYSGGDLGGALPPISGVLGKANVVFLGDSILVAGHDTLKTGGLMSGLGFSGAVASTAVGGATIDGQRGSLVTYKGSNGTNGNRLIVSQVGYNNISSGLATAETQYAALQSEMVAGGDYPIYLPITKGYPPAQQNLDPLNPTTDLTYGSEPLNRAVIWPRVQSDWLDNGAPFVNPYEYSMQRYGFGQPASGDGTHMTNWDMCEYIACRIAARALGMRPGSRAGKSLIFGGDVTQANRYLGAFNKVKLSNSAVANSNCIGLKFYDGSLDPFVHILTGPSNGTTATPRTAYLPDPRTHAANTVAYISGTTTAGSANTYVEVRNLWPGDTVRVGVQMSTTGGNVWGLVATLGSETITISDGSGTVGLYQQFSPIVVPESGVIRINMTNPAGKSYCAWTAITLDFTA